MLERSIEVKIPAGTIDWGFMDEPSAATSDVDIISPSENNAICSTTGHAEASSKKKKIAAAFAMLLAITVCTILVQTCQFSSAHALWVITWNLHAHDSLGKLTSTLGQCAQDASDPNVIARVSTLSRSVIQGEQTIRHRINDKLALAGGAVRYNPESCDSVHYFWSELNATHTASDNLRKDSQDLLRSVTEAGMLIEDALQNARPECKQVVNKGGLFARLAQNVPLNELLVFKFDAEEALKDEQCIARIGTLVACAETQKHLSTLAFDRKSRLEELSKKVHQWSEYPRRWIAGADHQAVACRAEDDVGGVEGLWQTIEQDLLATWREDV
jgi:hypothetical protein